MYFKSRCSGTAEAIWRSDSERWATMLYFQWWMTIICNKTLQWMMMMTTNRMFGQTGFGLFDILVSRLRDAGRCSDVRCAHFISLIFSFLYLDNVSGHNGVVITGDKPHTWSFSPPKVNYDRIDFIIRLPWKALLHSITLIVRTVSFTLTTITSFKSPFCHHIWITIRIGRCERCPSDVHRHRWCIIVKAKCIVWHRTRKRWRPNKTAKTRTDWWE